MRTHAFHRWTRLAGLAASIAVLLILCGTAIQAPSAQAHDQDHSVARWVTAHATPLSTVDEFQAHLPEHPPWAART